PAAIRSRSHAAIDLGRDHDLFAVREVPYRTAEDLLAAAQRIAVRSVKEIDSSFKRPLDEGPGLLLAEAPGMVTAIGRAVTHAAETDPRYVEAGATELHIFHCRGSIAAQPSDFLTAKREPDRLRNIINANL